jgi:hypothetical protein
MSSLGSRFDSTLSITEFPDSYAIANQKWLQWVQQISLPHFTSTVKTDVLGPQGEELASQILWLGDQQAANVLIVLSGTHGIEGPCGSAIQFDLMESMIKREAKLPDSCAILLVHALNPWGYAWCRRCDNNGVDLNRNFVDFETPPHNPGYHEIRDFLFCADPKKRAEHLLHYAQLLGQQVMEVAANTKTQRVHFLEAPNLPMAIRSSKKSFRISRYRCDAN